MNDMKQWALRRHTQPGFTIVELLIVVVVIAILAAITIVAFNGVQNRARQAKAQSDIASVLRLIEAYNAEKGYYPRTVAEGTSLNIDWFNATAKVDVNCTVVHTPSSAQLRVPLPFVHVKPGPPSPIFTVLDVFLTCST